VSVPNGLFDEINDHFFKHLVPFCEAHGYGSNAVFSGVLENTGERYQVAVNDLTRLFALEHVLLISLGLVLL
jgi:hypothetical protein